LCHSLIVDELGCVTLHIVDELGCVISHIADELGLCVSKSWEIMLQVYKTMLMSHLDYCMHFWSPHYQKDVETLERVQRRFSRMLPGLEGVGYKERLNKIGLFSLERQRMRWT